MNLRRWMTSLGPPLLAALAVLVLVGPTFAKPMRLRATSDASLPAAEPPACRAVRGKPAAEQGGVAWYRLDPVLTAEGRLDGQRLVVGQVGGRAELRMTLGVESFAFGPSRGRVLVGNDDGRRSTMWTLDAGRRCAITIHVGQDLIRRAVFDPSGAGIVEFRLARSSRTDLGVWRRPADGSEPQRLLDPLPPNGRIGRVFATQLSWSAEGTRLVVTSCGESSCLVRVLDRASGRLTTIDDPRVGEVLGLVGDDLVAYGGCPALPCEIVAMEVRTGRVRVIAPLAGLAALAVADGRAVVAFEDYRTEGRVRVVGLDGTAMRSLPLGDGLRLIPGPDRALAAIELPAGTIALAEDGRPSRGEASTVFINLADGRRMSTTEIAR